MNSESGKYFSFPMAVAPDGRLATADSLESHLREELIQLILTNPGERLDLPDFGAGVRQLLFEGLDSHAASLAKARITQAIVRWLGHRLTLANLEVTFENSLLQVDIQYQIIATQETRSLRFQRSLTS
jgi:phage baseplate assembly protein W